MVIVTLTKNSAKTISSTASSLSDQTFKDFHWIIVDDKSTDSTLNIIKKYTSISMTILDGPNQGIFPAYNFVFDYLKKKNIEDTIFFIHSDDQLFDNKTLENVDRIFKKYNPQCLFGNIAYFKENNSKLYRFWNSSLKNKQVKVGDNFFKFSKVTHKDLIYGYSFPHNSFFFNSKIINNLPYYSTKYPYCSDYLWSLEAMLFSKIDFYFYDKYLIKMKFGGMSTNYKNIIKQQIYDFKIVRDIFYPFHKSNLICFFTLAMKKIRKIKQFFKKN